MKPTALDLGMAEYYSKMPELVSCVDEGWETFKYCKQCGGEVLDNDPALYATRNGFNEMIEDRNRQFECRGDKVKKNDVACPHCGVTKNARHGIGVKISGAGKNKTRHEYELEHIFSSDPIDIEVMFRRKVWLSKRREVRGSWWRKPVWEGEDRFFWEWGGSSLKKDDPLLDKAAISDKK